MLLVYWFNPAYSIPFSIFIDDGDDVGAVVMLNAIVPPWEASVGYVDSMSIFEGWPLTNDSVPVAIYDGISLRKYMTVKLDWFFG